VSTCLSTIGTRIFRGLLETLRSDTCVAIGSHGKLRPLIVQRMPQNEDILKKAYDLCFTLNSASCA
jgi:hypothetical protein